MKAMREQQREQEERLAQVICNTVILSILMNCKNPFFKLHVLRITLHALVILIFFLKYLVFIADFVQNNVMIYYYH